MSQFNSLQPLQSDEARTPGERHSHKMPAMLPTVLPQDGSLAYPETDALTTISMAKNARSSQPLQAVSYKTITVPLQNTHKTHSLTAALQGTMQPKAVRPVVVIPGTRKREPEIAAPSAKEQRLRFHLRHAIISGLTFTVLLITLFTLTPLGSTKTGLAFFDGPVQWAQAQAQQPDWNLIGRVPANEPKVADPAPLAAPAPMALPRSQYVAIAQQAAINAGIPPAAFVRQINQESSFNPYAISPAGAVGIAQFLPATAAGLGINPYDPVSALNGAARYMANLANQYGGDYAKGLAAYNAGPGNVQRAINLGGANWLAFMPIETQNYVRIIMG